MRKFKIFKLFIVLNLSVLSTNAQFCDITATKYKVCRIEMIEFSIQAPPSSYSSILWSLGDGDSTNQHISYIQHTYSRLGTFKVRVTLFDRYGKPFCTSSITINIIDSPDASIVLLSPSIQSLKVNKFNFADNSAPGTTKAPIIKRIWDFKDGVIDSVQNPIHSYLNNGQYRVLLSIVDSNHCISSNEKLVTVVDSASSIEYRSTSNEFKVYPNPFTKLVNVYLPQNKSITEIELLDQSGKSIPIKTNIKGSNLEILTEDLSQGIYILRIVSDKVYVFKLMAE